MKSSPPRLTARDSRRLKPIGVGRSDKRADPIYSSPEHRAWRDEVIRRSGGVCQDSAHDPSRPRSGVRLYADHVRELKDGGAPFDPANGLARCASCHGKKTIGERVERMRG
jgi:5-methylcytosine-specific restriction protein A